MSEVVELGQVIVVSTVFLSILALDMFFLSDSWWRSWWGKTKQVVFFSQFYSTWFCLIFETELTITTLTGKKIVIKASPNDSIETIKSKIEKLASIPVDQQK